MEITRTGFEQELLDAVDVIYAAATLDSNWSEALERVCEFVGARAADLNVIDPVDYRYLAFHPARVDPFVLRYMNDYMADLVRSNPRTDAIYLPMEENVIRADSDVWTESELRRMPFFADFLRPWGTYDSLHTWVRRSQDGRPLIALALHFDKSNRPPQREQRQRLGMLVPHIRRAFSTEERLQAALTQVGALAETLNHLSEPIALIDRHGRVCRANQAAFDILKHADGITLTGDQRILFSDSTASSAFSKAVAQCACPTLLLSGKSAPPVQVVVYRPSGQPLVVTLQPLANKRQEVGGDVAIMFISDPARKPVSSAQLLRTAYRLTPTESRLTQAICEGSSLKQYANAHQISYETARTYLRRVFEKTGARRQSELVSLVSTLD